MTESLNPRVVLNIINRYLEKMTDVIVEHEGTIDEFTGDGILVFFGAPRRTPDHPTRAVTCALAMQGAMNELNRDNADSGLPHLKMGIGVNCGELVVGNIGGEKRKKYGAVGSPINVAFRVEAQTSAGEILITPTVYQRIDNGFQIHGSRTVALKGIVDPVTLYQLA
jgi:class 3 adenylate cyclase